ncbi:META domain-containing protein [Marinobacterium sedimentorum]|uniref:META domain-containing protein n=1 Tax=Marinobacterium sedimentorum TaxID=2927804 RepID=UPI0020C626EB|nr:META domain-containing protein [Marinobacterium sedimentorum]MCP8686946.1 META domain-containing protein [Marinobacterium sedimentorum]
MKRIFGSTRLGGCALVAAGLLLAGCSGLLYQDAGSVQQEAHSGLSVEQSAPQVRDASTNMTLELPSLAGTRWQITRVADQPVPASLNSTIQFDDQGHVFGSAGCNQFTGTYELNRGGLRIERLATTRKLCFSAIMYQEEALLRVLRGAERVYLQADELILESARERGLSRMIPLPEAAVSPHTARPGSGMDA